MRRVRAAVIHISRWPSFAPPPATRITLLFPLPPPRVQTDQEYRQQLRTTDRMAPNRPKFQFGKIQIVGKFAKIWPNGPQSANTFSQNLTKSANVSRN